MADRFRAAGYDPAELVHPKDVTADQITEGTVVIASTIVRNPDPDAPATTRAIEEFEVAPDDVIPVEDVAEYTDGAVSYPDDTPVTHGVIWSYRTGGVPNFASIGYGDEMYGPDSDFDDPQRWDRLARQVSSVSDDFIRFKFPE